MVEPAGATSVRLRERHSSDWDRALAHPLIAASADGTVADAVFERWVAMNTQFLHTYRRFFIVMGALAPNTRASALMVQGLQWVDHEIEEAEQYGERRGIEMSFEPSPQSMDYSSFVMASAAQGWSRGLAATYGIESLYLHAWTYVRSRATPRHRFWRFIDMWSNDYQCRYVRSLSALLDAAPHTIELERIFRSVVRLEMAGWDEAWQLADPACWAATVDR